MENLIEIAKILTRKKIAKIEILDENTLKNNDGLFAKFYEALITERISTDEEAASFLYENTDASEAKYRQLKSRFRRRLLNTLFFVDINAPLAPNHERARYNCNKDWALVEIMLAYQAQKSALKQARQVLTTALKFHLSDLIVKSARMLREDAAHREDESAFEEYHALVKQYTPICMAEMQAEELYQQAHLEYLKPHFEKENADHLRDILDQIIRLSQTAISPVIQAFMYRVWILNLEIIHDHQELLQVAQQAVDHLQAHADYFPEREKSFFYNKKMLAHLHLHQFQQGSNLANKVLTRYYEKGSEAWFDFEEYHMLLLLHTENYVQAMSIFRKLASMTVFSRLEGIRKEKWELIEILLHYLVKAGTISPKLLPQQRKRTFSEDDFVESTVNYATKHATFILHRLVFQILFLLHRRTHTRFPGRMEQLQRLLSYELKKAGYKRAQIFARMLNLLEKAEFKLEEVHLDKYKKELASTSFFYRGKISEFEVVPYEKLWDLVCDRL